MAGNRVKRRCSTDRGLTLTPTAPDVVTGQHQLRTRREVGRHGRRSPQGAGRVTETKGNSMSTTRTRATTAAVAVTAALALGAGPALASDAVSQAITPGTRTASVADVLLTDVLYSHDAQNSTGTMTLTADDSTGSNAGWNVTVLSSEFVWTAGDGGASSGTNIPAANFAITSAAGATTTAGQAVDATNGPKVPSVTPVATLDTARKTLQAELGYGNGTYTQELGVNLAIPAQSAAGTYTGTLTTTIAAAP